MKALTGIFLINLILAPWALASTEKTKTLEELKQLRSTTHTVNDKEKALRFELLTEQAEELGCSHGYITTMNILIEAAETKSKLWNRLMPFESIVNAAADLSAGEAKYIVPGVVDVIESHATISHQDDSTLIRTDDVVYRLKAQPKPVLRKPSWTDFLYEENKLTVSEPIPELLPSNEAEQKHYESALSEGWSMCEEQAIVEMRSRAIRGFKTASGMVRYVNLVESNKIDKPMMVIENVGVTIQGDEMGLGTQYVSLDGQASWLGNSDNYSSPIITTPRDSVRKTIASLVATGELSIQEIEDALTYLGK
jgi:hypothetical protein